MRGRLEPIDTDREDRHVAEDEDIQEKRRALAEALEIRGPSGTPEEIERLIDAGFRDDADLGMTRADWDEARGRR